MGETKTEETMRTMLDSMRTYERTTELRLAVPNRATTEPPRLQQKVTWRDRVAGGFEWHDIPIVVVPDLPPRSTPEPSP